jgi:hypothetical protein
MVDFFGIRKQRRRDELKLAIMAGEIRALYLVIGSMISLLPKEKRTILIDMFKLQVSSGFSGDMPGLDPEARQLYSDSLSSVLQNFVTTMEQVEI